MDIKEVMYPPVYVSPKDSVLKIARLMEEENRRSVLVSLGNKQFRIVTERDILYKVVAKNLDVMKTKAEDIMSSRLQTVEEERPIRRACQLFTLHDIRRLGVVNDKDEIVGIVENKDTARYNIFMYDEYVQFLSRSDQEGSKALKQKIKDIMHPAVVVSPDTSVLAAATLMEEKGVGEVIAQIPDGRFGIATESDILIQVVGKALLPADVKVGEICHPVHTFIDSERMVSDASRLCNIRNMRRLPVIDVDKVVGMITEKDIANYCVFAFNKTLKILSEVDPESAKEFEEFEDERYRLVAKNK